MAVRNKLAAVRQKRGVAAADLARRTGVSRQTIYAIEAGDYVPNTAVALELARVLEVAVEDLFSLGEPGDEPSAAVTPVMLSTAPAAKDHPVRLARVADQLVAVPAMAHPYFLPGADGIVRKGTKAETSVREFAPGENLHRRLVIAGCDPALGLLADMLARESGLEVILAPAASQPALEWLKDGRVHAAGTHLEDAESGEFNLPYLRANLPDEDLAVVTFAAWEEGFVVPAGNPKKIRAAADLARKDMRFVNREKGSGARRLLDALLRDAGVPGRAIRGYQTTAPGHLAAAYAVKCGAADCCLASAPAARAFGLHFIPVREERFDLVVRRRLLELHSVKVLLDVLQLAALRRKLESVAGCDASKTGAVLAC